MTDCDHPKCREEIMSELHERPKWTDFNPVKDEMKTKMPKSWLWLGFLFVGLPLMAIAIKMWSIQEADFLRYASKEQVMSHEVAISNLQLSDAQMQRDYSDLKSDIKEILRLIRKEWAVKGYENPSRTP